MTEIYSTISVIAFIFAAAFLVAGEILFVKLDIRSVYQDLHGKGEKKKKVYRKKRETSPIISPSSIKEEIIDDEPPTITANGEEIKDFLIEYELQTELTETEELCTETEEADNFIKNNREIVQGNRNNTNRNNSSNRNDMSKFIVTQSIILAERENVLEVMEK